MSGALDVCEFLGIETKNIKTGPNGGNLDKPVQAAERRAHFNGPTDPATGMPGMHVVSDKDFRDTAVPGRQKEPWWCGMAMFMLMAGKTNSEIGEAANVTPVCVSQLRAQRWFQEKYTTLVNENGQGIMGVLQAEALASVETLVRLRDFAESDKVQLQAATTLLEHAKGKPVATVLSHTTSYKQYRTPEEEHAAIQEELRHVRANLPKTIEVLPDTSTPTPTQ